MKRFLLFVVGFALVAATVFSLVSWFAPEWTFDVSQKIKYPEYYAWRNSGATFPKRQFWIGFNTDRHRKDIFIGRTRAEIESTLPLLESVPTDDSLLQAYILSRQIPRIDLL